MTICLERHLGKASFVARAARNVCRLSTTSTRRYLSIDVHFQKKSILSTDTYSSYKRHSFSPSRKYRCKVLQHKTRTAMLSRNWYNFLDIDKFAHAIIRECGDGGTTGVSLTELCNEIESAFFELCIQNAGRPAAAALQSFVEAAVEAFRTGFSRDRMSLQLTYGGQAEFQLTNAGYRLTGAEEMYRNQWLDTIYVTLQSLKLYDNEASRGVVSEDDWLHSIVHRVLEGQRTGDEQSVVVFDRALATGGASGGVAAEKSVIAPQWVPVTQLVLLTLKVVNQANA